jgi:hypothetical protein
MKRKLFIAMEGFEREQMGPRTWQEVTCREATPSSCSPSAICIVSLSLEVEGERVACVGATFSEHVKEACDSNSSAAPSRRPEACRSSRQRLPLVRRGIDKIRCGVACSSAFRG